MSGWNEERGCFELTFTQAQRWVGRSSRGHRSSMPRHEIERRLKRDGLRVVSRGMFWDVYGSAEQVEAALACGGPNPPKEAA